MLNQNSNEYLSKVKCQLLENLRMLPHAPGVQMQSRPDDVINLEEAEAEEMDVAQDANTDKSGMNQMERDKHTLLEKDTGNFAYEDK